MSIPRSSLRSFLKTAKSTLKNAIIDQQRITLVIGNDAADLDSITSAIVLAYFRTSSVAASQTKSSHHRHNGSSHYPPFYVPILNIPRSDIRIRPEVAALLPYANLDESHLITLDDLALEVPDGLNRSDKIRLQPENTRLILVDHNSLAGPLADHGFSDRVVGWIDHHVNENSMPQDVTDEPRIIEMSGSCTSLVTEFCQPTWDDLSDLASSAGQATSGQSDATTGLDHDAVRRTWDAQIAKFAIASVLIDTHQLQSTDKTTDIDVKAVKYLESKIYPAPAGIGASWDRKAFFEKIHSAMKNLDILTPSEILRKDYKHWDVNGTQLGVSSVSAFLAWQTDKAGGIKHFRRVMKDFAKSKRMDIFAVMTHATDENDERRRELLLWAVDPKYNDVVDKFETKAGESIGLLPWHVKEGLDEDIADLGKMKIWWQKSAAYSRKQVAPLLRQVIDES